MVRSQKIFLTTIPSAVSGASLITWIEHFLKIDDPQEAEHIANVLLLYGYVYSLTDYKSYMVKNEPTAFYRFQVMFIAFIYLQGTLLLDIKDPRA